MIAAILLLLPAIIAPLRRNNFYLIHASLTALAAYFIENRYFPQADIADFIAGWKSVMLIFIVLHLTFINLTTFIAYGVDKRAAQRGAWRIPEMQLHSLEFLGGWGGALLGQVFFHHKNKKRSFQAFFWALLFLELGLIFGILKYMNFI